MTKMRSLYGDTPLHLLAVITSFAIAGYGFYRIVGNPSALGTLVWFVGAIVAHDLLAFPLYSGLNLIAHHTLVGRGEEPASRLKVPVINYIRIPAALSALALLLFFPAILNLNTTNYEKDTGQSGDFFFGRWLGLTAVLFLGSALIYAVQLRRASRAGKDGEETDEGGPADGAAAAGGGSADA